MSPSSDPTDSGRPFRNSVAIAALLGATMLVQPLTAARADIAESAAVAPVNLRTAGEFVILAKTGISTTGDTAIVGYIGTSPIGSTGITGFGLIMNKTGRYSKSSLVAGRVYAADYANPTPAALTTAVNDMQTAYTNAAGRKNPTASELGGGNIGGMTIKHGLYKWSSNVTIPTDVTLQGGPDAVWIFQIAGTLELSAGTKVRLTGGGSKANIFWQVAGQTTLGTTAEIKGTILDQVAIVLNTGAILNGTALSQTAVTLDASHVNGTPGETALAGTGPLSGSACFEACSALSAAAN